MKKAASIFVAAALAAFALAACGSDDSSDDTTSADTGSAPAGPVVSFAAPADGSFAYEPDSAVAAAGATTIEFDNPATLSHDLVLEDAQGNEVGKTDLISQDKASFTTTLKPGTYTFFCNVPGHEEGGMKGKITVK